MFVLKKFWLCTVLILLASCAQQSCKIEERAEVPMVNQNERGKTMSQAKDLTSRVFVYKNDGSLQCGQGVKIILDAMKKDLTGIEVFSAENKSDGMMRIQVCGAPTGMCNVFEIDQKDLDKAVKLGFKQWKN